MRALALGLLVALAGPGSSSHAAEVHGVVVDRAGAPVEFANVVAPALKRGTVADGEGRFRLALPAGTTTLWVTQIGYRRGELSIAVGDTTAALRIVLAEDPVPVAEVTVAASSFGKAGKSEGAVLRRMDVMMTPGGTADVFQSLRTLPGINAPNEGAAVYVRGGDPRETLIRLDSGTVGHPYHYEGASGGLFSTIDSYMLRSAFFSSGGFGAKYGGVLSGVLDIETQDPLDTRSVSIGANLAGVSASSSWALVPGRLSLVTSAARSMPDLLFRLYGSTTDWEQSPRTGNLFLKLLHRATPARRFALSWLHSGDDLALIANELNVKQAYRDRTRNHLVTFQHQELIGRSLAVRTHLSGQFYESRWTYGPFGGSQVERNRQGNVDAIWSAGPRHELSFGANLRRYDTEIAARTYADSTDLGPGAPMRELRSRPRIDYPGVYVEDKLRLFGPVYATVGGRADHLSRPAGWSFDPRGSLAWRVDGRQTVRIAAGRYHQPADLRDLDPVYGNPDLAPLRADHLITGYEWKSEFANVRVEGYRKDYRGLVTRDSLAFYANGGSGFARGIDVFVQGTWRSLSGWVSYGYMESKRKERDDPVRVPSKYGVPHSVTVVAQYLASSSLRFGARYSGSTGGAYTPVTGRTYDADRALWRPVYGDHHSARLPAHHRLDLRVTRLFSLPAIGPVRASAPCVLYLEGINVLAIRNVLEYVYNSDYSRRYALESYFSRRLLVAGVGFTW